MSTRRREQLAAAAGYTSWTRAIAETLDRDPDTAAAHLGVAPATVTWWREHGTADARAREELAHRAGHPSWADAVEATRHLPATRAADLPAAPAATITRWRRRHGAEATRRHEEHTAHARYTTHAQALQATAPTPPETAATLAGTTEDDIRQRRATLKTPTPSTAGTTVAEHTRSAADAGYPSWRAAVERTRGLTLEEAATTLGVDTDDLRRARNAGGAAAVREREHAARRAGHPSWADAVDATIALTVDQAARAIGVTTDRIRTWRRILVGPADAVRRNAAAVGAGYTSWDDALARTSGLPAARAAAELGVDASTVRRWRGPRRDDRTVRRERRAHEAGHASWAEAIRATATLPAARAARELGGSIRSIQLWRAELVPRPGANAPGPEG